MAAGRSADGGGVLGPLARLLGGLVLACLVVTLLAAWLLRGCDLGLDASSSDVDPGTGQASARLPVEVTPRTGLTDGAVVRVRSDAFDRNEVVALAVCLREADTDRRGAEACDTVGATRVAVDPRGHLDQTVAVPRVITVGGTAHDCAAAPGGCLLVAASAADLDRSGGQPLEFVAGLPPVALLPRTEPPPPELLPVAAAPPGPYRGRTEVTVTASGFRPHEPLLLARCTDDLPRLAIEDACDPIDDVSALFAVGLDLIDPELPTADAQGAVVVTMAPARRVTPYASEADPVDCTARADRCSLVVAAAADPHRAAVLPYTIAAG